MINSVTMVGRLTRDPELNTTTTGKSVVNFSIAVNKRIKPTDGSPDADFFRVQCWGNTAEFVSNYLHKGRLVGIVGRLQSRKYTANDGSNREIVEIVADTVQSLERPRDEEGGGGQQSRASHGGDQRPQATAYGVSSDEYDPFADE